MKKATGIIVSLLMVLSLVGLSFAADEKEAAPAPAKKERHHGKKKGMHAVGEVIAVDAVSNTLTVKGKKGEVTLTTDDNTMFRKGKTLADVKVGDKVAVTYKDRDGKMVASSVKAKTARVKKEKKAEKTE